MIVQWSRADPGLDFGGPYSRTGLWGPILWLSGEKFLNTVVFYRKHYHLGALPPGFPGSAPVSGLVVVVAYLSFLEF